MQIFYKKKRATQTFIHRVHVCGKTQLDDGDCTVWPGTPTEFLHHVARNETVGGWVWRSGVARGGGGAPGASLGGGAGPACREEF